MTTPASTRPFVDVRMRGFRDRATFADVLRLLDSRTLPLESEPVPLREAAGRVLAASVVAGVNVPGFARAAMDGYAVQSQDTATASASSPVRLAIIGESLPGRPYAGAVGPSQAVRVMTGAPVPAGADAVLMAEFASEEPGGWVLARAAVVHGRNVGRIGEDVAAGREVLRVGRRLRPQDVGLLASIGVSAVNAIRRPRVALLVTGDELLPPGATPEGFRIVDSNSPMLVALVARDAGTSLPVRYLSDRYEAVRDAVQDAVATADLVLVAGGSSVGKEDHAPRVVANLGELAVHGVALRPAGPLGVGFVKPKPPPAPTLLPSGGGMGDVLPRPVILLPGNPVSCLCGYDLFAGRVVRRLGGRAWELPYRRVTLPLAAAIVSAAGRVDYVRVRIEGGTAHPITASGASVLSSTVIADGFTLIDHDREGYSAGEVVDVWLYDEW